MSAINAGFVLAGGDQLGTSSYYWSSSEYSSSGVWISSCHNNYAIGSSYLAEDKHGSSEVRPVLEF